MVLGVQGFSNMTQYKMEQTEFKGMPKLPRPKKDDIEIIEKF